MAVIQKNNDALQSQIRAITEMNSLEAASRIIRGKFLPMFTDDSMSWALSMCQCINTLISNVRALHQPNSPKLRKLSQLHHGQVCKVDATPKINISNAVAGRNQLDNGVICDMTTVPEMKIVEVLAELRNCINSKIGQVPTLCKN